jgi:hypothetical protein
MMVVVVMGLTFLVRTLDGIGEITWATPLTFGVAGI